MDGLPQRPPRAARSALDGFEAFDHVGEAVARAIPLAEWATTGPSRRVDLLAEGFRELARACGITATLVVQPGAILELDDEHQVAFSGTTSTGVWLNEFHVREGDPDEAIRAVAWWFRAYHRDRIVDGLERHPLEATEPELAEREIAVWRQSRNQDRDPWESEPEYEDSERFSYDVAIGYWRWMSLQAADGTGVRTPADVLATLGASIARLVPAADWRQRDDEWRRTAVDRVAGLVRDSLELAPSAVVLPVTWERQDVDKCGSFSPSSKKIVLNEERLCDDPTLVLLDTLPHELTHARQQAEIDDNQWRDTPSPHAEPFHPASVVHAVTRALAHADEIYDWGDYAGYGYSYNDLELDAESFAKRVTRDYWRATAYSAYRAR